MRDRLINNEKRRMDDINQRLEDYKRNHLADSHNAMRLRKLLSSRPKLIFGNDEEDSVIRVSCLDYTGFDRLSGQIVNIATGRYLTSKGDPIFRGHVGARIPRMRLQVRDVVRQMGEQFNVVEWEYFLEALKKEKGIDSIDDVCDALHFLANVGELCYFGDRTMPDGIRKTKRDKMLHRGHSDSFFEDAEVQSIDEDASQSREKKNG